MSGKQEKKRRREQGISVQARRAEHAFDRIVVDVMERRASKRAARRVRNRKGLAIGALAVLAALAAAGIGAVI